MLKKEDIYSNVNLIHFLLNKKGVNDKWWADYEDLVQDILLRAVKDREQFDEERASLSVWLDFKVRTELKFRKVKWERNIEEPMHKHHGRTGVVQNTPVDLVEDAVYAREVFDSLTEVQKLYGLGYTYGEIGEMLGYSEAYLRNTKKGLLKEEE